MSLSVFDLFSIGIGPSSSHTVGPMRAARSFVSILEEKNLLLLTEKVVVDLYGSLALTGKGHLTDVAILLGLMGSTPETVDPEAVPNIIEELKAAGQLPLLNKKSISFDQQEQLLFHKDKTLPLHPNGMRFTAYSVEEASLFSIVYYSIGGGFIVEHSRLVEEKSKEANNETRADNSLPYPFSSGEELLAQAKKANGSIFDVMMANEMSWRSKEQICQGVLNIWDAMQSSIKRGCLQEGILPGGLGVKRRAHNLWKKLSSRKASGEQRNTDILEWVSLWALAVNEENAAAGRVVTAPTNGAAGVIPAVISYYVEMVEGASREGVIKFLLTSAAIGILYKTQASISAAEMGCMGEVGVACSMAAAGLAAVLGGTNEQIENAAEIGMEHNLGLTCDPIMGLVQIPCIERNTMGAIKAINAAILAVIHGDGTHRVSLDQVIATMRQTGKDMQTIYKETSLGGLAVNVPEC